MRRFDRTWLLLLIPIAAALYLAIDARNVNTGLFEPAYAAMALLAKGYIGDPYGLPSGPSAHVSPVPVIILAGLFRVFGPNSEPSRIALAVLNGVLYVGACVLLLRVGARLAWGWLALLLACSVTMLVPVRLYDVLVVHRQWDIGWANLLLMAGLLTYLRALPGGPMAATRAAALLGLLAGIGALTSVSVLPPLLTLAGLLMLRHWCMGGAIRLPFIAAAVTLLCIAPWAVRNAAVLGSPVLVRSNLGLELSFGNWDGSVGYLTDPANPVSPEAMFGKPEKIAALQAVGEVAYMNRLKANALAWITDYPVRFAELTAKRVWLTFVPPTDNSVWVPPRLEILRDILAAALGIATLASLLVVLFAGRDILPWLAVTVLPTAPYMITHVNDRYVAQVFFPRVCLIAFAAQLLWERWRMPPA